MIMTMILNNESGFRVAMYYDVHLGGEKKDQSRFSIVVMNNYYLKDHEMIEYPAEMKMERYRQKQYTLLNNDGNDLLKCLKNNKPLINNVLVLYQFH